MKINKSFLAFLHLDRKNSLLNIKEAKIVLLLFNNLDVHNKNALNGIYLTI